MRTPLAASLAALLAALLGAGAARAGEVRLEERPGGAIALFAKDAAADEVLDRLRGRVNLIYDAALDARVTIDLDGVPPAEAVRRVAAAAGLEVEEAAPAVPGAKPLLFVRRPRAKAAPGPTITEKGGVFYAKEAFAYPVVVLRDGPEDEKEKARLSRFEITEGLSLLSAPDLEMRVVREYLEAREVYRAIAERAGVPLKLGRDVDDRRVRIYVNTSDAKRAYAEILLDGEEGETVHLVYDLYGKAMGVTQLTVFRRKIR